MSGITRPQELLSAQRAADLARIAAFNAAYLADLAGCKPTARKGGRFPHRPWLPVIRHPKGSGVSKQSSYNETIRNRAYATREEAVALAEREIIARRIRHASASPSSIDI